MHSLKNPSCRSNSPDTAENTHSAADQVLNSTIGISSPLPIRIQSTHISQNPSTGESIFRLSLLSSPDQLPIAIDDLSLVPNGPVVTVDREIQIPPVPGQQNFISSFKCLIHVQMLHESGSNPKLRIVNSIETQWTIGELDIDLIGVDPITTE